MARASNRLTARTAATIGPGLHADGDGLYLKVDASGARRWTFIFQWRGKRTEMGLGAFGQVSLAEARQARNDARKQLREKINPVEARNRSAAVAMGVTFGAFAEQLVADLKAGWRNPKHRQQWSNTLATYCAPIWKHRLDEVTTDDVLSILKPIWSTKAETASRLRGRIERVLDAAKAKGHRDGENPARWRGHLENLLPKRQKLQRGHHAALPYADAPAFMKKLQTTETAASRALQFTILTAVRENEALGSKWSEFDLEQKVWTIPAGRMKGGKPHRVPLSDAAMKVLGEAGEGIDLAFPGRKDQRPLSNMTMDMLLRRMKVTNATVHGFRSTFRDWAGEETDYPREVIEAALAHTVGNAVERAYRRGDALEKRRELMADWAGFLA